MKEPSKAKQNKKDTVSYSDAMAELEQILADIESGETDIDTLSVQVKKALTLVKLCKAKLRNTDEEIAKVMNEFKDLE
jgi:exodeoxyribonuclease VII small subunit